MGNDFPSKDFPVKFARDVVAKVPHGKRLEQLKAAKQVINDARTSELAKVGNDLQGLGIDWSDAPADVAQAPQGAPPPNVEVKLETDRPGNEVNAGDPMQLKVTVTNKGTVTAEPPRGGHEERQRALRQQGARHRQARGRARRRRR